MRGRRGLNEPVGRRDSGKVKAPQQIHSRLITNPLLNTSDSKYKNFESLQVVLIKADYAACYDRVLYLTISTAFLHPVLPLEHAAVPRNARAMPRLALLQSGTFATKAESFDHHEKLIRDAAAGGANIVVTQELFLTPYFCTVEDPALFDLADPLPGPVTDRLGKLAGELGIVLISSLFEHRGPGLYHNTAAIHDADGSLMGLYRKSHIPQDPAFEEKFYFTPGDSGWPVWDTRFGKIGVLICWDQWYPEAARLMALGGAQVLVYPTAIGWLPEEKPTLGDAQHCAWETVQRGHAVANGCYLAAVNRTGTQDNTEFWGRSFVANPYGELVAKASTEKEEILYHDLDFQSVEDFRRIWPFFRDRRIDAYGELTKRWR
jgi:N-carbamoylputrescine amidase